MVLIGLPGSGKSTWVASQGATALSSDALRHLLRDDITDQSIHLQVFRLLREILRMRIEFGAAITYVDATNLTPRERRSYIKTAELYGCDAEAVFFDVPYDTCKARNMARSRVVPEFAMLAMREKMVPPRLSEGFTSITIVTASEDAATTTPPEPAA